MKVKIRRFLTLLVGCCFFVTSCATTHTSFEPIKIVEFIPENEAIAIRPLIRVLEGPTQNNTFLKVELLRQIEGPLYSVKYKEKVTKKEPGYNPVRSMIGVATIPIMIFAPMTCAFARSECDIIDVWGQNLHGKDPNAKTQINRLPIKEKPNKVGRIGAVAIPWPRGEVEVMLNQSVSKEYTGDEKGQLTINVLEMLAELTYPPYDLNFSILAKIDDKIETKSFNVTSDITKKLYAKLIDMSSSPPQKFPPYPIARAFFEENKGIIDVGLSDRLVLEVTNKGKGKLSKLKAVTESPDPLFNGREFLFGKISVDKTRAWAQSFNIPITEGTKEIPINIKFSEEHGYVPDDISIVVRIKGKGRPGFSYSYKVIDDMSGNSVGNGDGRIQKGEAVDILFSIKNVGTEEARGVNAEIRSIAKTKKGLVVNIDNAIIGNLSPDETKSGRFTITVKKSFKAKSLSLKLTIKETNFGFEMSDNIKLALDTSIPQFPIAIRKLISVKKNPVNIHGGAAEDTFIIAQAPKGTTLMAIGELNGWYQVEFGKKDKGWVRKDKVIHSERISKESRNKSLLSEHTVIKVFKNTPPLIAIAVPKDNSIVASEKIRLIGSVVDDVGIKRLDIEINGRSIGDKTGNSITQKKHEKHIDFNNLITLKEGKNRIIIKALDFDGLLSTRAVSVNKKGFIDLYEELHMLPQIKVDMKNDNYAVVIGIERYRDIKKVEFAKNDVRTIKRYLNQLMGYPEQNIIELLNERATKSDIEKRLGTWLKKRVNKKSTVFIYYAGHGAPDIKTGEAYIVPYDGDPNDLETTAYPLKNLYTSLSKLPAGEIIVALDSCFSGEGERSVIADGVRKIEFSIENPLLLKKNIVIISASEVNSTFYKEAKHGLFTYFFLKGLKGEADLNKNGRINIDEIYRYIKPEVEKMARLQNIEQIATVSPPILGERGKIELVRFK